MAIIGIDPSLLLKPISQQAQTIASQSGGITPAQQPKPQPYAKGAPLAPWQTEPVNPPDQLLNRIMSGEPIIDVNDPLVQRAGSNQSDQALFAAYRALDRMLEAAQYAATGAADPMRSIINSQFQNDVSQVMSYVSSAPFSNVTVIAGVKQSSVTSTIVPPSPPTDLFNGATIASDRSAPIPGLTGTEKFTVSIDNGSGTPVNVPIDLSNVGGPLTIDNVTDYINSQLTAAGVATRFNVNRQNETAYNLAISLGGGETMSIVSDPSTVSPAVYVAGTSGTGDFANGYLQKLQGVDGAAPTQSFFDRITSSQAAKANSVATDSQGNVYVVGSASGDVGTDVNRAGDGSSDVMLSKYDASGNLIWQRLLGSTADASGAAVTVDANDNVIVAGRTDAPLSDGTFGGMTDSFVTKFDGTGQEQWTHQAGSVLSDAALSVTTDAAGNVYFAGRSQGNMPGGGGAQGGDDAYVTKLDVSGNLQYTKQFGSSGSDNVTGVQVDASGNVIVAGNSGGNGYVRKYADSASNDPPVWSVDLGSVGSGATTGLAVDESGHIFVSGYASGGSLNGPVAPGQAYQGGTDGFVARVDDAGTSAAISYVSYVGSAADDQALGVAAQGGAVYLTGNTGGSIGGQARQGSQDAFAAKLDAATGALAWSQQFGGAFSATGNGLVVDPAGTSAATRLGLHDGALMTDTTSSVTGVTTAREGQYFTLSVNGQPPRRVSIADDDSFGMIAVKLNSILGNSGRASAVGGVLSIKATNGGDIQLFAGKGGQDALASLGLQPARLFDTPPPSAASKLPLGVQTFLAGSLGADSSLSAAGSRGASGGSKPLVYDLGLGSNLSLASTKSADDAVNVIKNAMRQLRDAYRYSVTGKDPNAKAPSVGAPPAYLQQQIASYQNALSRIQGITGVAVDGGQASILSLFGI